MTHLAVHQHAGLSWGEKCRRPPGTSRGVGSMRPRRGGGAPGGTPSVGAGAGTVPTDLARPLCRQRYLSGHRWREWLHSSSRSLRQLSALLHTARGPKSSSQPTAPSAATTTLAPKSPTGSRRWNSGSTRACTMEGSSSEPTMASAMCGAWRPAQTVVARTCRSARPRTFDTATAHHPRHHLPLPAQTPSAAWYSYHRARGAQRASMAQHRGTG